MAKLIKEFRGVPNGEIYPVDYQPGDECQPELQAAALDLGVLGEEDDSGSPKTVVEIKAALDAAGIKYDVAAKKAELLALLPTA